MKISVCIKAKYYVNLVRHIELYIKNVIVVILNFDNKCYLCTNFLNMVITTFSDGSTLEYDKGAFDDWCVYLTRPNAERYAPRDFQYFKRLTEYAAKYGANELYNAFVLLYNETTNKISNETLGNIITITSVFGEDALNIAIDFTIMYMGMIAEENKAFSKLGKRIKRLGVHQVLIDNVNYNVAANFSRGKKWRELDALCLSKGF